MKTIITSLIIMVLSIEGFGQNITVYAFKLDYSTSVKEVPKSYQELYRASQSEISKAYNYSNISTDSGFQMGSLNSNIFGKKEMLISKKENDFTKKEDNTRRNDNDVKIADTLDTSLKPHLRDITKFDWIGLRFYLGTEEISAKTAKMKSITVKILDNEYNINYSDGDMDNTTFIFPLEEKLSGVFSNNKGLRLIVKYQNGSELTDISEKVFYANFSSKISVNAWITSSKNSRKIEESNKLTEYANNETPFATNINDITIGFSIGGTFLKLDKIHISKMSILDQKGTELEVLNKITDEELNGVTFYRELSDLFQKHTNLANGDKLYLQIEFDENPTPVTKCFRVRKQFQGYGVGVFWIPYGIFSTDFTAVSKNGIALAPTPIGVGVGGKLYFGNGYNKYIGLSLVLNYTITPSSDTTARGSFVWTGLTSGLLFDICDYFYIGPGWSVVTGRSPRIVLMVGIAPTFIQILKLFKKD